MNLALLCASLLSLLTWGIHTWMGGPTIARPLLDHDLEPAVKWTHYYCWHIVTITLFSMSAGFAYAALSPSGLDVAVLLTTLTLAFTLWSLALIVLKRRPFLELPQWILFAAISAVALLGCMT